MGFRFRKSIKAGPFRVNLSKSGIGYSVGTKGLRFTKKAGGGTRTTASIPGTGISYVKDSKKDTKKTPFKAAPPTSSGGRSSGSGCLGPMTVNIILLLLVAFMGWAFLKMLPQPRSIWIALAIALALPVPKLQAWITLENPFCRGVFLVRRIGTQQHHPSDCHCCSGNFLSTLVQTQ